MLFYVVYSLCAIWLEVPTVIDPLPNYSLSKRRVSGEFQPAYWIFFAC